VINAGPFSYYFTHVDESRKLGCGNCGGHCEPLSEESCSDYIWSLDKDDQKEFKKKGWPPVVGSFGLVAVTTEVLEWLSKESNSQIGGSRVRVCSSMVFPEGKFEYSDLDFAPDYHLLWPRVLAEIVPEDLTEFELCETCGILRKIRFGDIRSRLGFKEAVDSEIAVIGSTTISCAKLFLRRDLGERFLKNWGEFSYWCRPTVVS